MKKTRSIRRIDNLGRIVIPMDMRRALEIAEWDELSISLSGNKVVIEKEKPACTFCGSVSSLTEMKEKFICKKCLQELSKL